MNRFLHTLCIGYLLLVLPSYMTAHNDVDVTQLPTIQEAWIDAGYFRWVDSTKTHLRITELGTEQAYLPDVSDGEQLTSAKKMFSLYEETKFKDLDVILIENYERSISLRKVPLFNTSHITDFSAMFAGCDSLTSVSLFDTSQGINFSEMFYNCESLASVPLFDTSSGTDFSKMFLLCSSLTSIPLFDTSRGIDFSEMFSYCSSLTTVPNLDTSHGTNFYQMFVSCSSLISKPLLNIADTADQTDMYLQILFQDDNDSQ